jgi:hypothetical protein
MASFFVNDKNSRNIGATLSRGKRYAFISTKKWLDHILGDFFTNSSGHPDAEQY